MSASVATAAPGASRFGLGRTFVGPAFDLLLIGGGLTVPLLAWLLASQVAAVAFLGAHFALLALLLNQAHFAASTVRLYTKPGAFRDLPFATMVLPILTLAALSLFVLFADHLGRHLWALYLSWSPFHYAAQTFGLASMYCQRSGCRLSEGERRFLRWACLMPFFKALLAGTTVGYGLGWLVPAPAIAARPLAQLLFTWSEWGLSVLSFAMPLALFAWIALRSRARAGGAEERPAMPWISLAVVASNGIWWVVLPYFEAFLWATLLHAVQYLAIVSVFHVSERMRAPANCHAGWYHVATLYALCVALGYALFQCWPRVYVMAGLGMVESVLLVIAAINVHHFIVDAFIWRIRRDAGLRSLVTAS
jgi:hypothetical protein